MALNFGRLSIGPETIGPQRTVGKDRGVKPMDLRHTHAPVFICLLPSAFARQSDSRIRRLFLERLQNQISNLEEKLDIRSLYLGMVVMTQFEF